MCFELSGETNGEGNHVSDNQPTVTVEYLNQYQAIRMTWQHKVSYIDLRDAFHSINSILNAASEPMYVIVDITSDPNFPLGATITEAASGPYRNPKLKAWLIIGSNGLARIIERILGGLTGRKNVLWFKSEAEVTAYLEQQTTP
jgi:hypothetical protein